MSAEHFDIERIWHLLQVEAATRDQPKLKPIRDAVMAELETHAATPVHQPEPEYEPEPAQVGNLSLKGHVEEPVDE